MVVIGGSYEAVVGGVRASLVVKQLLVAVVGYWRNWCLSNYYYCCKTALTVFRVIKHVQASKQLRISIGSVSNCQHLLAVSGKNDHQK